MSGTIEIIAAAVDENNLTMYKKDGSRIVVPQGDPRIKPLVDKIIPALARKEQVFLNEQDLSLTNHFTEAEESLKGVARFVRVLKDTFKKVTAKFSKVEPTHGIVGTLPTMESHPAVVGGNDEADEDNMKSLPPTKAEEAVAEIMRHAVPVSSPEFHKPDPEQATTVVAVMEDGTMIDGMEQIDIQFRALVGKLGSATAMANFLKRLATVKHSHSIQDLLKFMEKGELAIAEDGSVLVYKRLLRRGDHYVDCHSKNVKQRVGSYVCMDAALVDANRSVECSRGLHIARRDYLRAFSGDVCVLAKLAPEDVIAVPHGDSRKLRARAYHIIAELSQQDHDLVTRDKPMADTVLLGNAIAGNHIGIIEKVEITKSLGGGVIITLMAEGTTAPELNQELYGTSLDHLPVDVNPAPTQVDAKELAKSLSKGVPGGYADGDTYRQPAPEEPEEERVPLELAGMGVIGSVPKAFVDEVESGLKPAEAPVTKKSHVQMLVDAFNNATTITGKHDAAQALVDFKKSSRKSWGALGVPVALVDDVVSRTAPPVASKAPEPAKKEAKGKPAIKPTTKPKETKPMKPAQAATKPATKAGSSRQEQAKKLYDGYLNKKDGINARALSAYKRKAKVSWEVLGLPDLTKELKKYEI